MGSLMIGVRKRTKATSNDAEVFNHNTSSPHSVKMDLNRNYALAFKDLIRCADNGIGSRVQKIVFGISVRSLFLQITQQLFVPDNDFANKKIFGRVVLEYPDSLIKPVLVSALNDDLVPPVLFPKLAPKRWEQDQSNPIRSHLRACWHFLTSPTEESLLIAPRIACEACPNASRSIL